MTSTNDFAAGYQAALKDVQTARDEGGWEAVQEWLQNNLHETETADRDKALRQSRDYTDNPWAEVVGHPYGKA